VSGGPDLVALLLRWIWWRAVLHNGWWLATSVYLVVDDLVDLTTPSGSCRSIEKAAKFV
jgi:hypothetical protein